MARFAWAMRDSGITATISPTDSTSRKASSTRSSAGRPPTGTKSFGPSEPMRRPSPAPARITARSIDLPLCFREAALDRVPEGRSGNRLHDRGARGLPLRDHGRAESQAHRLFQPPLHLCHRAQFATEAHLADRHEI